MTNFLNSSLTLSRTLAVFTAVTMVLSSVPVSVFTASAVAVEKVNICHATSAHGNPYGPKAQTPNESSDVSGHDGHDGPVWYEGITETWGDIIPPFEFNTATGTAQYPGKNWTTEGQEIWNNDCQLPTTWDVTMQKKFSGETLGFIEDQFSFYITGDNNVDEVVAHDDEIELLAGTYSISEVVPPGFDPALWTIQWSGKLCENLTGPTTTIVLGEDQEIFGFDHCVADNQYKPGILQVSKVVVGASTSPADFSFTVNGGDPIAFESDGSNDIEVPAGDYEILEVSALGYTSSSSAGCSGTIDNSENISCTITNTYTDVPTVDPICNYGFGPGNLLSNGSFEEPAIAGSWALSSITNWVITKVSDNSLTTGELWNGLFGGASAGSQNVELDAVEPTKLTQTVTTIPGATYELRFDFSARKGSDATNNDVEARADGVVVVNASADGTALAANDWDTYGGTFVADASTDIMFVDSGTANGTGSLIDNAVLCLVEEPVLGCTDDTASNYDAAANYDDGSCTYVPEDPWCSYEGTVISHTADVDAKQNDGDLVESARRNPAAVQTVAPYQNIGGKEGNDWNVNPLDFYTLGIEGYLVYEFSSAVALDQAGPDIAVYEITGGTGSQTDEKIEVSVSKDGVTFVSLGEFTGDAQIDIAPAGLDYVKFVRLDDKSAGIQGNNGDGYDVDAIVILDGSCADVPVLGCTDDTASNYNVAATEDDGSCTYPLACVAKVNLVANASFEDTPVTHAAGWDIVAQGAAGLAWLIEWVSPNGDATDPASLELHAGVNGWVPSDGSQYAELDGDYQGPGGSAGEPASTKISQVIPTIPGEQYELTWDFSPRPNTAQPENDLEVFVEGVQVGNNTGAGAGINVWTGDSYVFTATENETTIAFADDGVSNSVGTFLDNVSLVCNPEPEARNYCGDGELNQEWEQCEVGEEGCTDYCTFENQCTDLQLVKITLDPQAPVSVSFDGIYLGDSTNPIPSGTWFNFSEVGDATAQSVAKDSDGLGVERTPAGLVLALEGGNSGSEFDYAFGTIEVLGLDMGATDRSPVVGWPLENTGSYVDVFAHTNNILDFKFWATTGDDAALVVLDATDEPYNCPLPEETYKVEGYVWHDDNENELWDGFGDEDPSEEPLAGRPVSITNGEETYGTTTDENGYYYFYVPEGTWTITETPADGWGQTAAESHVVIVPQAVTQAEESSVFASIMNFIIPTAHAVSLEKVYGDYNFGNNEVITTTRSGGGGGRRAPGGGGGGDADGDVPVPQVLGEQVSIVPAGAPDAGAGGAAPATVAYPVILAAFVGRKLAL